ncbi:outer dense fiber protein 3 [Trichonephila clavipes]|nr:outer dense fiber protein 3 [Trichonephila clavipes]
MHGLPARAYQAMCFMHDSAPEHFSIAVRNYLHATYPRRWIGRGGPVACLPREQDHDPRRLKAPAYKIGERSLIGFPQCLQILILHAAARRTKTHLNRRYDAARITKTQLNRRYDANLVFFRDAPLSPCLCAAVIRETSTIVVMPTVCAAPDVNCMAPQKPTYLLKSQDVVVYDPAKLTRKHVCHLGHKDLRQYYPCGPGAATYDTRKLTNKGIDECHAPKIGEKFKKLTTFMPPGPATYHRGDSDKFAYRKSPAYSMGVLNEGLQPFQGPAPDRYTLPPSLGTVYKYRKTPYAGGPAFTIGDRLRGAMLATVIKHMFSDFGCKISGYIDIRLNLKIDEKLILR